MLYLTEYWSIIVSAGADGELKICLRIYVDISDWHILCIVAHSFTLDFCSKLCLLINALGMLDHPNFWLKAC